jgi:hypothetical protein
VERPREEEAEYACRPAVVASHTTRSVTVTSTHSPSKANPASDTQVAQGDKIDINDEIHPV